MKTFQEYWENATIPNKLAISKIHAEHFWNAATEVERKRLDAAWNEVAEKLLSSKPRWIPVTERLPEKDEKYLIKVDEFWDFQTAWYEPCSGLFEVSHLDISSKDVTHWMAVPE